MALGEFCTCVNQQIYAYMKKKCFIIFSQTQTEPSTNQNSLSIPLSLNTTCSILYRVYENLVEFCTEFYAVLGIYWAKLASCVLLVINGAFKVQIKISTKNSVIWLASHKLWRPCTRSDLLYKSYSFLTCMKSLNEIFSDLYIVVQISVSHCRQCVTRQLGYSVLYQL